MVIHVEKSPPININDTKIIKIMPIILLFFMVSSGIISKIAGRIIIPMAIIPTVLTPSKNVKNPIMMHYSNSGFIFISNFRFQLIYRFHLITCFFHVCILYITRLYLLFSKYFFIGHCAGYFIY